MGRHLIHPVQESTIRPHLRMYTAVPGTVTAAIEHLFGLNRLYCACRDHVHGMVRILADQYPVEAVVPNLLGDVAACFGLAAEAALVAVRRYMASNPPPDGVYTGPDMTKLRSLFVEAHGQVFVYQPQNPPDLAAWLAGLHPMYTTLGRHVRWATGSRAPYYPGNSGAVALGWSQLTRIYQQLAGAGVAAHTAYEQSAEAVLRAHRAPRPHEHLTNVGR